MTILSNEVSWVGAVSVRVLKAVHSKDLGEILEVLGLKRLFDEGALLCAYCGQPVSLSTLSGIFVRNGRPHVYCGSPQCLLRRKMGA